MQHLVNFIDGKSKVRSLEAHFEVTRKKLIVVNSLIEIESLNDFLPRKVFGALLEHVVKQD